MLVECVPNFSCHGALAVELAAAAERVNGASVLGVESDADHNRTVLTLAGEAEAVLEAVQAASRLAVEGIDLREHRGVHPRTGAVDVVPFVPLGQTSLHRCVELSLRYGDWAAETLGLPVYLYEEAATDFSLRDLAALRRRLREPGLAPDFGPADVSERSGLIITGARFFLIAFNILLPGDKKLATRIARRVRASSGGLPAVKAKGFYIPSRGMAQVSMNLCDFRQTGVLRAFQAVQGAAQEMGVEVQESELIGLIPEAAVQDLAASALRLPELSTERIIEPALARQRPLDGFDHFLNQLGSTQPAPGGGSAAALAGALAAGCLEKALRLTGGHDQQPKLEGILGERLSDLITELVEQRGELRALAEEDARAFSALMAAMKLPRSSPAAKAHRRESIRCARGEAFSASKETLKLLLALIGVAKVAVSEGNPYLINDAALAGSLAAGAADGARWNALANLPRSKATRPAARSSIDVLHGRIIEAAARCREAANARYN